MDTLMELKNLVAENVMQKAEIEELKNKIEKMKNCMNCYNSYPEKGVWYCSLDKKCENNSEWKENKW